MGGGDPPFPGSDNTFYALRIGGHFPFIRTRTVSKQSKPYPRLVDAAASAPVFELADVTGDRPCPRRPAAGRGRQAIGAGLVDECHVFVGPVLVGTGTSALAGEVRLQLDLVDERRFRNGMVHLHYRTTT